MRLANKTRWSTDDLRALISACLKAHAVPSTGLVVEIIHARRSHHTAHGVARLGGWKRRSPNDEKVFRPGRWMKLIIASPETIVARTTITSEMFLMRVARVIDHEVAHLRGLDHCHMSEATYNCTQAVPWLGNLQLRVTPAVWVQSDKAAMREDRLEHARAMLKKATTREKRATTGRKKWERRVRALETILTEKGYVDPAALDAIVEAYETKIGPRNGARVVAKAWLDPEFKKALLADATKAIAELGHFSRVGDHLVAVENTPQIHNMIVCTLCSCYPWEMLGLPPVWYKAAPYRSRAVKDPRGVLNDFGVTLPKDIEIRVLDSTAETRFLVLPMRPAGTEGWSEDQLTEIVSRDSMIGTGLPEAKKPA
jgi:nitrile hydratase